jgi:predicted RNase H-like nuclease
MFFVGLDLAWKSKNRTGVVVVDDNGRLLRMTAGTTDDEIIDVIGPFIGEECLVAIDAPLIVPNEHGYPIAETLLNWQFKPCEAIAMPANKNREGGVFNPPRGAVPPTAYDSTWTDDRRQNDAQSRCIRTQR